MSSLDNAVKRSSTNLKEGQKEYESPTKQKTPQADNLADVDSVSVTSSSSEPKLKIDDESSDKSDEKITTTKKSPKARKSNPELSNQVDNNVEDCNISENSSQTAGNDGSVTRSGQKRSIDRGLDGGYWSRMTVGEMISDNKPKRTRHSVERLNLSVNLDNYDFEYPTSSKPHSSRGTKTEPIRQVLFTPKTFLTLRNEEGSFFLCQTINKIYDDSKKCRIQWMEGDNCVNSYVYGSTDNIDPNSIISEVNVKKITDPSRKILPASIADDERTLENSFYEIVEEDLKTVNKLLKKAITDGGIESNSIFESEEDENSKDSSDAKKVHNSAMEALDNKDFYDKEDSNSSKDLKNEIKKNLAGKKAVAATSSDSDEDTLREPSDKKKKIRTKSPPSKKPKSFIEYQKQIIKNKTVGVVKPKHFEADKKKAVGNSSGSNGNGIHSGVKLSEELKKKEDIKSPVVVSDAPKPFSKPVMKSNIEVKPVARQDDRPGKEKSDEKKKDVVTGLEKLKTAMKPPKVSGGNSKERQSDNDTDQLESDSETAVKKKKKQTSPKETINVKKMPVQENNNINNNFNSVAVTTEQANQNKKRRLFKVISNRYLDPNPKVTVFAKDPFFEEANNESEIPFISAYVESKLAFKALHLSDLTMLKRLINDVEHVPSVHVGKSVCSKWIPAEYALYLENKDALDMLIDNFVAEAKRTDSVSTRVEMPKTMFQKFTGGSYNTRSLGLPFNRKLAESRGVKEGNSAFTKDNDTLKFVNTRDVSQFFTRLFNLSLEHGTSAEMFDYLMAKYKACFPDRQGQHFVNDNAWTNIIQAILFGHRKLAAHILKDAPSGYGFNAVHIEVLAAENDDDLKCKLRANMCTKKPFGNDLVTPIHCACINPNVKYLKTLLSITQEYNIADKRGRKPIHYASVCEGLSPLEYLISRVSPYELDSNGCIPLHYACLAGRSVNVEMLLSHARLKQEDDSTVTTEIIMDNKYGLGGLNKPNRRGQLPIHLAISRNNYDCIKVLIKYGCNLEYPLPNSMGKITPLMYACQLGHQKIVQLLIDNYAKIEARDRHQRTATIHAAMCGHSRTLSYLLRLGANPNVCDSSGNSCLHYACAYGWYYCTKTLLDAGAQINVLNDWKLTPFGTAFLKGHVGLCDQLITLYPKQIDINFRTEDGETLVMLAVSSAGFFNKASVDQLEYIVTKLGGNCQLTDSKGSNAFHYLSSNMVYGHAIKAELSIDDKANQDQLIESVLQEHLKYRNQIAEILNRSGCNPNAENSEFETPFFTAIANSNVSFARYLLEKMNVNITDRQSPNGKTLLSLMAEKCVDLDICSIIKSNKELFAKHLVYYKKMAAIRNENGLTPLQIALIKLSEAAAAKTDFKPKHATNLFIKFLYVDCQSVPYASIKREIVEGKPTRYFSTASNTKPTNSSTANGSILTINPISLILNDHHIDLISDLIEASSSTDQSVEKIDFTNSFNEKGLSPLLQACADRQSMIVVKLIQSNVFTVHEICEHFSLQVSEKNTPDESIFQIAVRHGQIEIFEAIVDFLINKNAKVEEVVKLLKHVNANKQNFLSMLTFLNCEDRQRLGSSRFAEILRKLEVFFIKQAPVFDFSMFILELVGAKDRFDRSTLHTALINFHMHSSTSIDLEMFLLHQIFSLATHAKTNTDAYKQLKTKFFCSKDVFGRLPIHYLFYDTKHHQTNDISEANIYSFKNLGQKLSKNMSVYFGRPTSQNSSKLIDPVEILTVLIKQIDTCPNRLQFLDEQDLAGFTPLHYAAVRGATIACSLLTDAGCSIFKSDNKGNTPLSSSIYFKRATTSMTFIRSLTGVSQDKKNTLKAYYHYHEKDTHEIDAIKSTTDTETCSFVEEPDLKWTSNPDKDLHVTRRIPLYTLILLNEWEGISWLILNGLTNYGLDQFDALQAACSAKEFNFAIRLLEKFLNETRDPEFRFKVCTHICDDTNNRTLLHLIARLDLTPDAQENLKKFLSLIFTSSNTDKKQPDMACVKLLDKLGASAMHYACHMHNFAFVDFMVEQFKESSLELLTCKDVMGQTAYALLFWQIGFVEYKQNTKEKIKHYTENVVKRNEAGFVYASRAYFPIVDSFLNGPKRGQFMSDYPSVKKNQLVCPLVYAVNREDFGMTKFLIKDLDFNVNSCDTVSNKCALVYAIQRNNIRLCQLLLNVEFEAEMDSARLAKAKTVAVEKSKKMAVRIKGMLGKNGEDSEDLSEDEEINDESINNEELLNDDKVQEDLVTTKFEVKSNIVLNQLDNKQRSVFHHLACCLDYGSFHNLEICRLLFAAFTYINSNRSTTIGAPGTSNHRGLPSLVDFLKRVDSQQLTASDHALRNGNLALYEELQKCLNPIKPIGDDLVLNKFTVEDKFYDSVKTKLIDYQNDSELFLAKNLKVSEDTVGNENDCFHVDVLSNMSNTGSIVWDEKSKTPYDVVMTKTDVSYGLYGMHNFYKMQLISLKGLVQTGENLNGSSNKNVSNSESKFDPSQMCVLFTRWGRIGDQGQYQRTPFSTFKEARDEFCKVFKQKTANDFVDTVLEKKKPFENKPKRYILIKLDSRRRQKLCDIDFEVFAESDKQKIFKESIFKDITDYMHFFGDLLSVDYVKKQIQNSYLSTDYIPITRLSFETIRAASDILKKQLQPAIERRMELEKLNKKENLQEYMSLLDQINKLSNQFYDLIPQMNYNYEKLSPISTELELDEQMGTINRLTNSQIAVRILMAARISLNKMNPFDYVYRSLNVKLELLDLVKLEARYVLTYIPSRFHVKRVFKFEREAEVERFNKTKLPSGGFKQKNRWLLWHGTGAENMLSIMSKGLVIAPSDVKNNGNRFGKGIYFSDSFEASSDYSNGVEVKTENGNIKRKYMLLCEVALGNVKELQTYYETADSLPDGYDSVKALGKREPNPSGNIYMPNGVVCPLGEMVNRNGKNVMWSTLNNSQYVVYNESQVVIRYIVQYYE